MDVESPGFNKCFIARNMIETNKVDFNFGLQISAIKTLATITRLNTALSCVSDFNGTCMKS
jgi:hypothetical protein